MAGKCAAVILDAIPLLLDTLGALDDTPVDPDRRGVALNAIRALGLLKDQRADAPLRDRLHSNDYNVREEAARSLGTMGSPAAAGAIRSLLASGIEGAGREQPSSPLLQEPCEALLVPWAISASTMQPPWRRSGPSRSIRVP